VNEWFPRGLAGDLREKNRVLPARLIAPLGTTGACLAAVRLARVGTTGKVPRTKFAFLNMEVLTGRRVRSTASRPKRFADMTVIERRTWTLLIILSALEP
jgi:hypothetical protein